MKLHFCYDNLSSSNPEGEVSEFPLKSNFIEFMNMSVQNINTARPVRRYNFPISVNFQTLKFFVQQQSLVFERTPSTKKSILKIFSSPVV